MKHVSWAAALAVATMAAGCTKANPASCLDDHCSDPARPFCDSDGSIGGEPDTCIAVECTPGSFATCRDDSAVTCNSTGNNFDVVDCEFGCSNEAGGCNACNTSECERHIIPKYLPNVCNQRANGDLVISEDVTFDTRGELNCSSVVAQSSGPGICILRYKTITIERNRTFAVAPMSNEVEPRSRALALVADDALTIDGVLDVSADGVNSGAGGAIVRSGDSAAAPNGSGGAGNRTPGGDGGTASSDGGANTAGPAQQNPTVLAELLGGTRPKSGSSGNGGAGGAVTVISCRGTVSVPGIIDAGGGGGIAGFRDSFNSHAAGGGGSGGTVVIQGMNISVTGQLFSNGGGGGAGGSDIVTGDFPQVGDSRNGTDGTRSMAPSIGGIARTEDGGGNGGAGGVGLFTPPGNGKKPIASGSYAGGGGGSVGYLMTYTPQGVAPELTPTAISPSFEANRTIATNR